jgi:hypothetical protein
MKLTSFLFTLLFATVTFTLPSFSFSKKMENVKIAMTVDEHISYSVKNGALKVTTNRAGGFWILEKNSSQDSGSGKKITTENKKDDIVYIVHGY